MRHIILLNIGLGLVLLVVFTATTLPGNTLFWNSMQNAGHGLAMCFAAFFSISTLAWKSPQHTLKILSMVAITLFGLGILIEAVQHIIGRGASAEDILVNAVGIVAGMCFSTVSIIKFRLSIKLVSVLLGIVLITWCVRKPAYLLAHKWLTPPLPVIAHFDQFAADARIGNNNTTSNISNYQSLWPSSEGKSLMVTYLTSQWPHIRFEEIVKDWSNYGALAIDVFNSQTDEVRLIIRVDYQPIESSNTKSMIARRVLQSGHSSINVSFEELAMEVHGDSPNLAKITRVILIVPRPTKSVTLYFDNLRVQ